MLFLPDGNSLLERINEPAAGVKCRSAVSASDHDEHTGLADLKASDAMDDADIADIELFDGTGSEHFHLLERHFYVGVIDEVFGAATAGVVAHDAVKERD